MPPIRRSNLGRRTRRSITSQNVRDNQTEEERAQQNEWRRALIAQIRAAQSPPQIRKYVACSRVGKPSSLFVFAPENKSKNIVHQIAIY